MRGERRGEGGRRGGGEKGDRERKRREGLGGEREREREKNNKFWLINTKLNNFRAN